MSKTIAQSLIEEGEAEGIIKGALRKHRDTVTKLVIARTKTLSPRIKAKIEAAEMEQLDAWFDQLLAIDDPAAVPALFGFKK